MLFISGPEDYTLGVGVHGKVTPPGKPDNRNPHIAGLQNSLMRRRTARQQQRDSGALDFLQNFR